MLLLDLVPASRETGRETGDDDDYGVHDIAGQAVYSTVT